MRIAAFRRHALVWAMCVATNGAAATLSTGTDEQAQLPYWELRDAGMSLRLVQRLPDQTRGFFTARGFSTEHAERIAQSCVFQTVFKNESHGAQASDLEYSLWNWVVSVGGKTGGMKTREDWSEEWVRSNTSPAAQLAFEWALYPTQQVYRPGDYNWGMSIFNLKPATTFDLTVVWMQHGREHRETIRAVQCAPDVEIDSVVVP